MSKEKAKALLEAYANGEGYAHVYLVGDKVVHGLDYEINYKLMIEFDAETLIADAREENSPFQLLLLGAAYALRNKLDLPAKIRLFIAEYLEDPSIRPKRRGGTKEDFNFNWTVRVAMAQLTKSGIKPTRNEATLEEDSECGLDIIRCMMRELGINRSISYEAIRKIWERTNKRYA